MVKIQNPTSTAREGRTTRNLGLLPWHPISSLHDEIDRLFDGLLGDPLRLGAGSAACFCPRLDLREDDKTLIVQVELPGLSKKDIDIELHDNGLVLRGEKKAASEEQGGGVLRAERCWGAFERVLPLPVEVDVEAVEATFRDGVLTVHLPKAAPGRGPRKIEVGE